MSIDGMAARARRLAELEAAQASRELAARAEWEVLATRSRALGQPLPEALAGRLQSVYAARAEALDVREHAVRVLETTLSDWRAGLTHVNDDERTLSRLRDRLRSTLADEISELNPAELSRVVARAFGEGRHTGPLNAAPSHADPSHTSPPAGVEQEALLLGHLLDEGEDAPEAIATTESHAPDAPEAERTPVDTINHPPPGSGGHADASAPIDVDDVHPLAARGPADPADDDTLSTGRRPAALDALLDDPQRAMRRPRSLMREPQHDAPQAHDVKLEIDVDVDSDDPGLRPGDETLSRWLGTTVEAPTRDGAPGAAIAASIESFDDPDAFLEWHAADVDDDGALLTERRRPSAARTSIIEVVRDPFDAFDDFDDSLDAPFGFVEHVTGQGPALPDADWSIGDQPADDRGAQAAADIDGDFESLQFDDPFADDSAVAGSTGPSGSTNPDPADDSDSPLDTVEIARIDPGDAFPAIGAPLGADSMDEPAGPADAAGDAFEGAFADRGPGGRAVVPGVAAIGPGEADGDTFDFGFGPDLESAPASATDAAGTEAAATPAPDVPRSERHTPTREAARPAVVRPTGDRAPPGHGGRPSDAPIAVSDRPTSRPRPSTGIDSPPGGSLLPAPPDPGRDGWGPRSLEEQAAPPPPESSVPSDDAPDHVATDFGAALIDPASEPIHGNPFALPQLTQPGVTPMPGPGSTNPDPAEIEAAANRIDAHLDAAIEGTLGARPQAHETGDAHLTGLDWPPPRALHAFPDGSMDSGGARDSGPMTRSGDAHRGSSGFNPWSVVDSADGRLDARSGSRHRSRPVADGDTPDAADAIEAPITHGISDGISDGISGAALNAIRHDPSHGAGDSGQATPGHAPGVMDRVRAHAMRTPERATEPDVFDPSAFGPGPTHPSRARNAWRSAPVAPSASLADALDAARHAGEQVDVVPAGARASSGTTDAQRRATDRFTALAGDIAHDPWASLDIPDHAAGGPDAMPALTRNRRQGRAPEARRSLPTSVAAPKAVDSREESAPRAPMGVRVGLEAGDQFFTGFSRDISVDGIFVKTQHGLEVGRTVEVFFELPGGRSVNAQGRVRRVRRGDGGQVSGLGVRFHDLTREVRVHIGRYVARTLTGKIPLP